jgi:hypothetical protein
MPKPDEKLNLTQGQTSIVIALLLGAAVFVGWSSDRMGEKREQRNKAETAYIVKHECVVAVMDGRVPSKYRCDLPEKRYLSSAELNQEALAEAAQGAVAQK